MAGGVHEDEDAPVALGLEGADHAELLLGAVDGPVEGAVAVEAEAGEAGLDVADAHAVAGHEEAEGELVAPVRLGEEEARGAGAEEGVEAGERAGEEGGRGVPAESLPSTSKAGLPTVCAVYHS